MTRDEAVRELQEKLTLWRTQDGVIPVRRAVLMFALEHLSALAALRSDLPRPETRSLRDESREIVIHGTTEEIYWVKHASSLTNMSPQEYIKRAINKQLRHEGVDAVLFVEECPECGEALACDLKGYWCETCENYTVKEGLAAETPSSSEMSDHDGMGDQRRKAFAHAVTSYGVEPDEERYAAVFSAHEDIVQASHAEIERLNEELLKRDTSATPVVSITIYKEAIERAEQAEQEIALVKEANATLQRTVNNQARRLVEAEAALSQQGSGWQPISTAPKDEAVLLWMPRRYPSVAVGAYWETDDGTDWGWWAGSQMVQPTHWQPLPAPPEVK